MCVSFSQGAQESGARNITNKRQTYNGLPFYSNVYLSRVANTTFYRKLILGSMGNVKHGVRLFRVLRVFNRIISDLIFVCLVKCQLYPLEGASFTRDRVNSNLLISTLHHFFKPHSKQNTDYDPMFVHFLYIFKDNTL